MAAELAQRHRHHAAPRQPAVLLDEGGKRIGA
jgi:hypothetical protein